MATRIASDQITEATRTIEWARSEFGEHLCLATSFTDTVLIDLTLNIDPDIPVFFSDTGFHFAETLRTMKATQVRYQLDLRVVRPQPDAAEVWTDGPTACCDARKVLPLLDAMADAGFRAWLTGLRRCESPSRAEAPIHSVDRRGLHKIAPIASWSDDDVAAYTNDRDLIVNPLLAEGYQSVGCWPCTEPANEIDPRSGRWSDSAKSECGLHLGGSPVAIKDEKVRV